ncbi:TonB-dependent receptor [Pseudoxanthomonas sp. SE1]|uniref:TonB-dependent receptor family protein n=1 Tax=Pseudoxanthomonas sp. SE1 TaxID=1664560 RepID=UPI00240DDC69|nr:TonB-dependent receptor [Pseudoxanthomonas sp. SE1]WFC42375.1 TonB-dependent receptor [Pseudoxanthomonas sp. SE1]
MSRIRWKLGSLLLMPCAVALAEEGQPVAAETLDRVVVVATRLESVDAFDVPASADTIVVGDGGARSQSALSEVLVGVPGLLARERQNLAQDTQLSIRGFGARSTFGVRGLRLYADGVPATMPDGQGQVSHFNMLGADRVEVLRGPFSALHGNSSGGVIQLWSDVPGEGHEARVQASVGSHGNRVLGARIRGARDIVGYSVAASMLETDGYRAHSAAGRDSLNAKVRLKPGRATLDLVFNHFGAPDAEDPLGLTRAQAWQDPRQATPVATQFDTRKSVRQDQLGAVYEWPFASGHLLRAMAYGGRRDVEQYLALPGTAQANPLNAGGVIDLDNDYGGADLRWSWTGELAGRPFEVSAGTNADRQRQHRRGYENFVGTVQGVRGTLRRDERNQVGNVDQYAQAWWRFASHWSLLAGARHSRVAFRSRDAYVTVANPDDSGQVTYERTTPVAGLVYAPTDTLRLYASIGRGFETPTFNEIGYRADGGAGLAFDLRPAVSRNVEVGMKWRDGRGARVEAALFRADTDDELAVARNVAGRSSYRNAGAARRQGVELQAGLQLHTAWRLQLAYTWLDATFRDGFPICTSSGCTTPGVQVAAGTRIPGIARQQASVRLGWQGEQWSAAAQLLGVGAVTVNDTGSERAPGHGLLNLELVRDWPAGSGRLQGFARIDNALDRFHIGSVIVNEGNGRFYEPGAGRTFTVGLRWHWADR